MVTRAVDEIAAFAVRNARHVLVAALALSVVISLGFARTDVDTDPTLLDLESTLGAPNDLSKVLLTGQAEDTTALNVFFVNSI